MKRPEWLIGSVWFADDGDGFLVVGFDGNEPTHTNDHQDLAHVVVLGFDDGACDPLCFDVRTLTFPCLEEFRKV